MVTFLRGAIQGVFLNTYMTYMTNMEFPALDIELETSFLMGDTGFEPVTR